MSKVYVGIQARLGSTRLPKKTSMPFGDCDSLIEYVYSQWQKKLPNYHIVILAPRGECEDPFWVKINSICEVFYGDDNNLLKRYSDFAEAYDASIIVRATGDNPFVHKELVLMSLDAYSVEGVEYLSSKSDDGCNVPQGLGVEVFSIEALKRVSASTDECEQEHVSEAFTNSQLVECGYLTDPFKAGSMKLSETCLTLDHLHQYNLLRGLI
ncbi:conserved hypothetical protein [Vibrio chagasii]|nr:conserved hypothetical protein [Vibrio chagasii]CAH7155446.1 conserved hypothetical protein [Vibrio chagasii]CAH7210927.1 conserved hypothetical protein [Vibrio chagasii]